MKAPKQERPDRWTDVLLYVAVGLVGMWLFVLALLMLGAWLSRMGV